MSKIGAKSACSSKVYRNRLGLCLGLILTSTHRPMATQYRIQVRDRVAINGRPINKTF